MSNYPFDTFPLTKRVGIVNPVANLDARYGPWPTFNDALTGFNSAVREKGLTVAVSGVGGNIVEYWYRDGIADNDLILKIPDIQPGDIIPSVTNYLSTNNVLISSLTITNTFLDVNSLTIFGNISGNNSNVSFNEGNAGIPIPGLTLNTFAVNKGTATGPQSFAAGEGGFAQGARSFVGGGFANFSNGNDSFTTGQYNRTDGLASMALGHGSFAEQNWTYIWSDGDLGTRVSNKVRTTRTGQYMVSASGGVFIPGKVGIGTDSIDNALTVIGTISTSNHGNSQQWNSTYTTLQSNSASFYQTLSIVPTANNLSISNSNTVSLSAYEQRLVRTSSTLGSNIQLSGTNRNQLFVLDTFNSYTITLPTPATGAQINDIIVIDGGIVGSNTLSVIGAASLSNNVIIDKSRQRYRWRYFIGGQGTGWYLETNNTSHRSTHSLQGNDPITPGDIGALPLSGGTVTGPLNVTNTLSSTQSVIATSVNVQVVQLPDIQFNGRIINSVSLTGTNLVTEVTLPGGVKKYIQLFDMTPPILQYFVDFEDVSKGSYGSATITPNGINWNFTEALIGTLSQDWKNGLRSARLRGFSSSIISMIQDKEYGLGTLTFFYSRYGTDPQVQWIVEYSMNQGSTWTSVGTFTATAAVQQFSAVINQSGNGRIRIRHNSGGDLSTNRRANVDDILITEFIL